MSKLDNRLDSKYIEAVGRRKTSTARVRLYETDKDETEFFINEIPVEEYFPTPWRAQIVREPFEAIDAQKPYLVSVLVKGSGKNGQAEAIRHGISRVLVEIKQENRRTLKKLGYLKRDSRMKERKKPGLKKARKSEQWSKR